MINNTPLYIDLLDYLERDGIASLSNDFDSNAFMTNFDELDTTSPLINNPTVTPTTPYIIPPLGGGGGDGGDGPRQGLGSLNIDPIDKIIDYTNFNHPTMNEIANDEDDEYLFDAENFDEFYDPMNRMGMSAFSRPDQVKNAITQAAYDEAQRVAAFERQQKEAEQAAKDRAEKAAADKLAAEIKAAQDYNRSKNTDNNMGGDNSNFGGDRGVGQDAGTAGGTGGRRGGAGPNR